MWFYESFLTTIAGFYMVSSYNNVLYISGAPDFLNPTMTPPSCEQRPPHLPITMYRNFLPPVEKCVKVLIWYLVIA